MCVRACVCESVCMHGCGMGVCVGVLCMGVLCVCAHVCECA